MVVWFCIKCFYTVVLDQSFPSCVSKIQKLIKSRKSKKFDRHCWVFVSKYVLPCTFVQMALCIYEHSLFPMHSYHCGRNFEIYVTVVNRSSTLSWKIGIVIPEWWTWWRWLVHSPTAWKVSLEGLKVLALVPTPRGISPQMHVTCEWRRVLMHKHYNMSMH